MTGNCCRQVILGFRGRPIAARATFEKLLKRKPDFAMFVPHEQLGSDGILRFRCSNLGSDNRCSIHPTRPDLCRRYPDADMVHYGGALLPGCGYKIESEKSFDEILEKIK